MNDLGRVDRAMNDLRDALMDALARPPANQQLLSIDEAADRLAISKRTLMARIADGTVRTVRIGRRRLVPASVTDQLTRGTGT